MGGRHIIAIGKLGITIIGRGRHLRGLGSKEKIVGLDQTWVLSQVSIPQSPFPPPSDSRDPPPPWAQANFPPAKMLMNVVR